MVSKTESVVELIGIEPTTPCLQSRCSPRLSYSPDSVVSCQSPVVVGLDGLEPSTPALSRRCSNQLSYRPDPGAN